MTVEISLAHDSPSNISSLPSITSCTFWPATVSGGGLHAARRLSSIGTRCNVTWPSFDDMSGVTLIRPL